MNVVLLPGLLLLAGLAWWLLPPPGWLLIAGGLALPLWPRLRAELVVGLPLLVLALIWQVPDGPLWQWPYLSYTLTPLQGSAVGRLFATAFAIAALAGGLFALRSARTLELSAALVYAGSAIGVALGGDWLSLFLHWELMALGSSLVLWAGGERARAASFRYIFIHLFGGVLLMAGIAGHLATGGSAQVGPLALSAWSAWLILAGVLVNAAAPPLWSWVADAYPEASPSGTVFLSAFTTKTAVLVLWLVFPGVELLRVLGLIMVGYGIVYALLEGDARRILAYSIVSQVGYMVTAIGIGSPLALAGAAAHAFAHIAYKALLLMSAGAVLAATGRRQVSELGGLAPRMPLTAIACTVGALSISALPWTAGFASKSLIMQAAADAELGAVWFLLTAASASASLYIGLRLPWLLFFGPPRREPPPGAADPPASALAGMALLVLLCLLPGWFPELLYGLLPYPVGDYRLYSYEHVLAQLQLLAVSAAVFWLLRERLLPAPGALWDLDWFYRHPGKRLLVGGIERIAGFRVDLERGVLVQWQRMQRWLVRYHGPQGRLARTWPTGSMVLWVAVLLSACLLFYYR
ncbi:MAG TPA: proton-conducting transporter membrane subunit [Candidatus Competibacteraceae bacterium]|nr:proton-conducting transporter membrane subunit [Candidatus Competibacteraceae bacterium]